MAQIIFHIHQNKIFERNFFFSFGKLIELLKFSFVWEFYRVVVFIMSYLVRMVIDFKLKDLCSRLLNGFKWIGSNFLRVQRSFWLAKRHIIEIARRIIQKKEKLFSKTPLSHHIPKNIVSSIIEKCVQK